MILNFVTKWREAKGVTKAHLARRVGVSRSYITKLEQGKMQPSGEMMFRIAKYLGQPLEVVFRCAQAENRNSFVCAKVMPDRQTFNFTDAPPPASGETNKTIKTAENKRKAITW